MLKMVYRDRDWQSLSQIPLGQRNSLLLQLREQTFGNEMSSMAECPACQEKLEFTLSARQLRQVGGSELNQTSPDHSLTIDRWQCWFRPVTSEDLLFLEAPSVHPQDVTSELVKRCLTDLQYDGHEMTEEDLPKELLPRLSQTMLQHDPLAETVLNLSCPSCQHQWEIIFDIAAFLWTEIAARSRRLLWEVHHLASAYGWREADILAMSAQRRWWYLEMVQQQ